MVQLYFSFAELSFAKEASKYLNKVANSKEYGNQAKYYLGYLAYEGDNYEEANELFGQVSDQDKYKEKMGYYCCCNDNNNSHNQLHVSLQYLAYLNNLLIYLYSSTKHSINL